MCRSYHNNNRQPLWNIKRLLCSTWWWWKRGWSAILLPSLPCGRLPSRGPHPAAAHSVWYFPAPFWCWFHFPSAVLAQDQCLFHIQLIMMECALTEQCIMQMRFSRAGCCCHIGKSGHLKTVLGILAATRCDVCCDDQPNAHSDIRRRALLNRRWNCFQFSSFPSGSGSERQCSIIIHGGTFSRQNLMRCMSTKLVQFV